MQPQQPPASLDRRTFLQTAGSVSLLGLVGCSTDATAGAAGEAAGEPFQISLAQWSFNRRLRGREEPYLDPLDFAPEAGRLGFAAVEYVNQFFMDKARDENYLSEMKRRADGAGVKSLLIMCDYEGELGDPDPARRRTAVENHHKWVDAAAFLGCHSIRVNAESHGSPEEQKSRVADGLAQLTEYAAARELNVLVENHGGISSNGAWLASVLREVDHPRCGSLPDFGNFELADGEWYDAYQGVEELMPFAKAVSAKAKNFDANGDETKIDYRRMTRIVYDAGYRGWVGIEYEGKKIGEIEGVVATKRLLERCRAELAS